MIMCSALAKPAVAAVAAYRCHCGANGIFGYLVDGEWQWFCAQHRLQQWSADARPDSDNNHPILALPIETHDTPPDLQALVAAHGGYDKITSEAWDEYDRAMSTWQAQRREKYEAVANDAPPSVRAARACRTGCRCEPQRGGIAGGSAAQEMGRRSG
jgi:hypothetical protein